MWDCVRAACLLLIVPFPLSGQTNAANRSAAAPPPAPFAPLTERERVIEYLKSWVNPFSLVSTAASGGIGQWTDEPPEWKEGSKGYERRVASAYAGHAVNATLEFALDGALGEDNRYYPSGRHGKKTRLEYALESTVLTRVPDSRGGYRRRIAVSRLVALAGAALISRLWQPPSTRGLEHATGSFFAVLAVGAGFNVAREFLHIR